jgi:hypothetical protein
MEKELTGGMINMTHVKKKYLIEIDKKSSLFYELVRRQKIVDVKRNEQIFRYIFDEIFEMIEDDDMINKMNDEIKEIVDDFFKSINSRIEWYEILTGNKISNMKFVKQFLIFFYIHGFENIPYKIVDIVKILYTYKYDYELLARIYQYASIQRKKETIKQLKSDGYDYKNMKFSENICLNKDDWKEIEGEDYNSDIEKKEEMNDTIVMDEKYMDKT